MNDRSGSESIVPVSRRNVLKAGAVTAVGAGLFSGTAAATNANQINFCGCSQICVEREDEDEGLFYAVTAWEEDSEWHFGTIRFGEGAGSQCEDVEGTEKKIIALMPQANPDGEVYCNPNQCAQKALKVFLASGSDAFDDPTGLGITPNDTYTCANEEDDEPAFGSFEDIKDTDDNNVEIVRGRCGKPGRTPPGRE